MPSSKTIPASVQTGLKFQMVEYRSYTLPVLAQESTITYQEHQEHRIDVGQAGNGHRGSPPRCKFIRMAASIFWAGLTSTRLDDLRCDIDVLSQGSTGGGKRYMTIVSERKGRHAAQGRRDFQVVRHLHPMQWLVRYFS